MSFIEKYNQMTTGERNQFGETVNNLLFQCFITKMRFDRTTTVDKVNQNYAFIERFFSVFEDYLSYMDMQLVKDDNIGVIYCISTAGKNHLRVDSTTTIMVYALRSFYEEKLAEVPTSSKVWLNSATLKMYLRDKGLSTATKRITNQQIATSLRLLSNYNIVMRHEHHFYDNNFSFFILPPIRCVINTERMNALYTKLTTIGGDDEEGNFSSFEEGE